MGTSDGGDIMSDIAELERRITAALDRVGTAITRIGAEGGGSGDAAALTEQLAEERTANAQLHARVEAIKDKQETMVAGLEADVARLSAALARRDGELQSMRAANAALRENNAALRTAATAHLADADAVTSSLESELAALQADRRAEQSEVDEILSALRPILNEETAHG